MGVRKQPFRREVPEDDGGERHRGTGMALTGTPRLSSRVAAAVASPIRSASVRPACVPAGLDAVIAIFVDLGASGQYARFFLGHGRSNLEIETNAPT